MESLEKNLSRGNNIESLYEKAKGLLDKGKDEEAAEILADLAKSHEMSREEKIESLYEASRFLSQQGNYGEAAELLIKAHKLSEEKDN